MTTALLGCAAATAAFGAAHAVNRVGWVWADQPNAAIGTPYTPNSTYSFNPAGAISITPISTGYYQVTFSNLDSVLPSDVQVTAYSSNGYCQSGGWSSGAGGGNPVNAYVRCFDADGNAANQYFTLLFQARSDLQGNDAKGMAFLWADQETAASYTPSSGYSYNSTGGTNTITRSGPGVYTVSIPGLTKVGGHVQVTAYGSTPARCKTAGWGQDSSGTNISVLCFNNLGAAADTKFDLSYSRQTTTGFQSLATTSGFYAWASRPNQGSYKASGPYSYNAFGTGKVQATLESTGNYSVHYAGNPSYSSSNVLVTAYGDSNRYCNVANWSVGSGTINVQCFDQGGAPVNTQFDVSYDTH